MGCIYFYDLPVYRLSTAAYVRELDEYIDKVLFPATDPTAATRRAKGVDPRTLTAFHQHLNTKFGCWQYNEIIGYIKLHFLGTQVRGEYFAVQSKSIRRARTKVMEYKTWKLAPEVDIEPPCGNAEILAAIRTYIADCRREEPRRFIDATLFDTVAPHVEWRALFSSGH